VVEYDGTGYAGFQTQPGRPTIQGELELQLSRLLGHPVTVTAAGRTDAGVHATGQVVNFRTTARIPTARIPVALNRLLPPEIAVREPREVPETFNARRSARSRVYRYTILNEPVRSPLRQRYAAWIPEPLAADLMAQAAEYLVGEHDFGVFQAAGSPSRDTMREIYEVRCRRRGSRIEITLEAGSFLYRMVRLIVAALVAVGTRRLPPEAMREMLATGKRPRIVAPAPPEGLCLVRVRYRPRRITRR
jgi:tRNA pseudouridine38-40 synthase